MAKSAKPPRGSSGEAPPMLDEAQFRMTLDRPLGSLLTPEIQNPKRFAPLNDSGKALDPESGYSFIELSGVSQLAISQNAVEKIKHWENDPYNEKPEVPGGGGGVTIGYGYDLSNYSKKAFREDWGPYLDKSIMDSLERAMDPREDQDEGPTGKKAKALLADLGDIRIPEEVAYEVLVKRTIRRFTRETIRNYPNSEKLSPDSLGALVSWSFNRGPNVPKKKDGIEDNIKNVKEMDDHSERRMIRDALLNGDEAHIPALIDFSKRLWDDGINPVTKLPRNGVYTRRQEEAEMFKEGLGKEKPKDVRFGVEFTPKRNQL